RLDHHAVRREPAEGRDRTVARRRPAGAAPQRPDPRHRRRRQARPVRPPHPAGPGGPRRRDALHRGRRARRADGPRPRLPGARALPRDRPRVAVATGARLGVLRRGRGRRVTTTFADETHPQHVPAARAGTAVTLGLRLLNRYSFAFALLLTGALLATTIIRD